MDKQLDIRFDRVEKALGTLVDSIAKYNPSTQSAHDFVAADAELCKGLEECTSSIYLMCLHPVLQHCIRAL